MASSMIHIAVANEVNKKLNRNLNELLIGTIAPDISKLINEDKVKSHFLDNEDTAIPNLYKFLNKYKNNLNDDFVLGYYIHLLTDYFWFKNFVPELSDENVIFTFNGDKEKYDKYTFLKYMYEDYTNLNLRLIDEYNLNLKIFYMDIPKLESIIEEIPMNKINLIVEKAGQIIENSKEAKPMLFNIDDVKPFIATTASLILLDLEALNINNLTKK